MPKIKHLNLHLNCRVPKKQFEEVSEMLGLVGCYGQQSRVVQTCLTMTQNVIANQFGGNVAHLFKRRKDNIEQGAYEKSH